MSSQPALKKKKKSNLPWCWYCEREFDDEKVLIQHQKMKHFKCLLCSRKLNSPKGMFIHMAQVHKQVCSKVPNAIDGRDTDEIEVYGMEGIPVEDLLKHHEGDLRKTSLIKHEILTSNQDKPSPSANSLGSYFAPSDIKGTAVGLPMPSSTIPSSFRSNASSNPFLATLLTSTLSETAAAALSNLTPSPKILDTSIPKSTGSDSNLRTPVNPASSLKLDAAKQSPTAASPSFFQAKQPLKQVLYYSYPDVSTEERRAALDIYRPK